LITILEGDIREDNVLFACLKNDPPMYACLFMLRIWWHVPFVYNNL